MLNATKLNFTTMSDQLNRSKARRTALVLTMAAGTAAAGAFALSALDTKAMAQSAQQDRTTTTQERQVRNLTFMRSSDLLGAKLRNDVEDDLGTIDEVIINRGTGRIEHVVIREGGFLGFGGSHVALPFEALVINPAEESVAINVAAGAISEGDDRPLPQGWTRLNDGWEDRLETLESARSAREQSWGKKDDANGLSSQRRGEKPEETKLNGRITSLDRKDIDGQQWAVASVQTSEGQAKKVVLGPAWHVYGNDRAPIRGDTFEGTVHKGDKDHMILSKATINGDEFRFNNDRGQPSWRGDRRTGASGDDKNPGALALLSEVTSRDAKTRDSNWGQIEDSIIELSSGSVAFLVLDPDENFLGIGDEFRVVPWTIVSVGSESVVIDATRDMLTSAETLPEDVRVFTMPRNLREVYLAYGVEQPEFRGR